MSYFAPFALFMLVPLGNFVGFCIFLKLILRGKTPSCDTVNVKTWSRAKEETVFK